jgi:hypothetical protein
MRVSQAKIRLENPQHPNFASGSAKHFNAAT